MENDTQDKQNVDYEQIRKNWHSYRNEYAVNTLEYDAIWKSWIKKYKRNENSAIYKILRRFIDNNKSQNKQTITYQDLINEKNIQVIKKSHNKIILRGLDGDKRKSTHLLCDEIGLHHVSENYRGGRDLCIIMPKNWSWEFSQKNPYIPWKARKYCSECGMNGIETQLFCSPYISELFCEDCIDSLSDGDGGELSGHKFEPI